MAADQDRASPSIEELTINTIRTLALDAVEKAASGHPGTPMAMAPVGYTLWSRFLRYDPDRPDWPNRDRFVLSVGHASLLLYSLLHLAGVREIDADGRHTGRPAVSLDDIKQFRQLDSRTPGPSRISRDHRRRSDHRPARPGLRERGRHGDRRALARRAFQPRRRHPVRSRRLRPVQRRRHDGRRGERGGLARRASQAFEPVLDLRQQPHHDRGRHRRSRSANPWPSGFAAMAGRSLHVADANDLDAVAQALETFRQTEDAPTLIVVDSVIGWGSPVAGTAKAHSDPMGAEAIRQTKRAYGWPEDAQFLVPPGVADHFARPLADRSSAASRGLGADC